MSGATVDRMILIEGKLVGMTDQTNSDGERLRYQLFTGPDTHDFSARVSAAIDEGYVLHGSPAITFDGTTTYVAQAVVLRS